MYKKIPKIHESYKSREKLTTSWQTSQKKNYKFLKTPHSKLKIEQHELHQKSGLISGDSVG